MSDWDRENKANLVPLRLRGKSRTTLMMRYIFTDRAAWGIGFVGEELDNDISRLGPPECFMMK